jgi:hypothetical protein
MRSRRELMRAGIAFAAIAAAPVVLGRGAVRRSLAGAMSATPILIADRALPEAAAFGAVARSRGFAVREFDGDVGPLWMNLIELRLRAGAVSILGATSAATLFCIETLARDYGATAVARADARAAEQGFAEMVAADGVAGLPPFAHVRSPLSPTALIWRIESHPRFRSTR